MTTTPDGKQFYVTCEAGGDIYVIDAHSYTAVSAFQGEWTAAQRGISLRGAASDSFRRNRPAS